MEKGEGRSIRIESIRMCYVVRDRAALEGKGRTMGGIVRTMDVGDERRGTTNATRSS